MNSLVFPKPDSWRRHIGVLALRGRGGEHWLDTPMTAFFASRQCPGVSIRAGLDWALKQVSDRQPVISGFHSPLERSVLGLLLEARSPAVVVLARTVELARLCPAWENALAGGNLVVISLAQDSRQLTEVRSHLRNDLAAMLAKSIVIAHASPSGSLLAQTRHWQKLGLALRGLLDTIGPRIEEPEIEDMDRIEGGRNSVVYNKKRPLITDQGAPEYRWGV